MSISTQSSSPLLNCYKAVILGESGVGKTSLSTRFVRDSFSSFQEMTIGAAFYTKTLEVDGETFKFEIWDTAGQERYHSLAPMYYRGAKVCIVVYDITNPESYTRAKRWVQEIQQQLTATNVIAFVGNKCDQPSQIDKEEVSLYVQENNLLFMETSAKESTNVTELFQEIARKIPSNTGIEDSDSLDFSSFRRQRKRSCC